MSNDKLIIEIDDKETPFTDFYPEDECLGNIQYGSRYGENEITNGRLRCFEPTKPIWFLNVFNRNPDGTIWGIKAAYRNGKWTSKPDDARPVLRVWDRIV